MNKHAYLIYYVLGEREISCNLILTRDDYFISLDMQAYLKTGPEIPSETEVIDALDFMGDAENLCDFLYDKEKEAGRERKISSNLRRIINGKQLKFVRCVPI